MRAMQISSEHPLLLRIVDDLAEHGWSQQNLFLPLSLTGELAAECRKRAAEGELAPGEGSPLWLPVRENPPVLHCGRVERALGADGGLQGYLHYRAGCD